MSDGGSGNANALFDKNQWPRVGVDSPLTTDAGGVTLYVRLPANSKPVSAINFAAAYGGFPKSWTLSGSIDGGQTWYMLNERSDYVVADTASMKWMDATDGGVLEPEVPKAFLLNNADSIWMSPGVRNMPGSMQVEVDVGAVLDFTNVTGGQVVDSITLDAVAGGGTIRNARFAADGTIFLTGVPDGMHISRVTVPIELEDCEAKSNLGLWGISVNGVRLHACKYHAVYRNGLLFFQGNGLNIFFR